MSEEQAAEAAHQQSENAEDGVEEKEVVEEGDGDAQGAEDGVEAMEEDDEQQVIQGLPSFLNNSRLERRVVDGCQQLQEQEDLAS